MINNFINLSDEEIFKRITKIEMDQIAKKLHKASYDSK